MRDYADLRIGPGQRMQELTTETISALPGVSPAMRAALAHINLPMALIDLGRWRVLASNTPMDRLLVGPGQTSAGRLLDEFLARVPEDGQAVVQNQLADLGAGRLLGYEAKGPFELADGSKPPVHSWFRRLDVSDRQLATMILIPIGEPLSAGTPAPFVLAQTSTMAIVVTDHDWRAQNVSSDITEVLGYAPAGFIGKPLLGLVHPADAPNFVLSVT